MATTTFTNGVTTTDAEWFNDVDDTAYGSVLPPAHNSSAIWKGGNGDATAPGIAFSGDPDTGVYRAAANKLGIATAGAARVLVDDSGNVGIGTASPDVRLQADASNPTKGIIGLLRNSAGSSHTGAQLHLSQNGIADWVIGQPAATDAFAVWSNRNTGSDGTEHLRVDANGYLLVGYTSSQGPFKLQVNSQIFATNSTVTTSDARYKQNVTPITGALAVVAALRPVTYRWKAHPIHEFDLSSDHLGFIAQEVDQALASTAFRGGIVKSNRVVAARGDRGVGGKPLDNDVDEEFMGLAEGKLVPILAAAIKELKAIVDAQAVRIAALEAR